MYEVDEKVRLFMNNSLWEKAIQKCIDKGIHPYELSQYTSAEYRATLLNLILSGEYHVAPPHIALIPKDNGEFRKVYVNTVLDRLVLTLINEVYNAIYGRLIHERCVSYQKGIGVRNIVENISRECSSSEEGFKIDISKYFDSVPREVLNEVLHSVSTDSCLDQIIYDYYNDDLILDENKNLVRKYKSLCQGCAPSAFFANLTLRDIDQKISCMVPVYYRYSDDILLLGEGSGEALAELVSMLEEKGLKVNPKKVEKICSEHWFTFLGCNIRGSKVSLSKKSLKNFMNEMTKRVNLRSKGNKNSLKASIRKINNYLYLDRMNNPATFGWAEYFFSIINCEEDIIQLDEWLKDLLRASYTGKQKIGGLGIIRTESDRVIERGKGRHVKKNLEKTEGLLEECGYISMHHLWKMFRLNRDIYRMEVYKNAGMGKF